VARAILERVVTYYAELDVIAFSQDIEAVPVARFS
jgi:hypothetical protein